MFDVYMERRGEAARLHSERTSVDHLFRAMHKEVSDGAGDSGEGEGH